MSGVGALSSKKDPETPLLSEDHEAGGVCAQPPAVSTSGGASPGVATSTETLSSGAQYLLAKSSKATVPVPFAPGKGGSAEPTVSYPRWSTEVSSDLQSGTLLRREKNQESKIELGVWSRQRGEEEAVSVAGLRVVDDLKSGDKVTSEVLSLKVAVGTQNGDGSTGFHVSKQATAAQTEWTHREGAEEITVGLGAGIGYEFSYGTRDIDGDGLKERCVRFGVGPFVYGQCMEDEDPKLVPAPKAGPTAGSEGGGGY